LTTSNTQPETNREKGIYRGKAIAKCFTSPDGLIVLVGKTANVNDVVTFKFGRPKDFWFHVAADSGSHVIVLNPDGLTRLPKESQQFAAALAAGHSKARAGGLVDVHMTTCEDVTKPRGAAPGKVQIRRWKVVRARPRQTAN